MYINSVIIKNFRCFVDEECKFHVPDGNLASGLNILIGENGNGKTSILEAITFLTESRLKIRNSLKLTDFNNPELPLSISGITKPFNIDSVYSSKTTYSCIGLEFNANARQTKSSKLLNSIAFDTKVIPKPGTSPKDFEIRVDVTKPWGTSRLPDFQLIYFDKNRSRHVSTSMYPTKFDKVVDDLNAQSLIHIQSLDDSNPVELAEKNMLLGVNNELKTKYPYVTDKLIKDVNDDFIDFMDKKIELGLFRNLEPFNNAFFSHNPLGSHLQLSLSQMGSGVEMLYSLIFLYRYYSLGGVPMIIVIDEPEMHLHPAWQLKLTDYLKEISKTTQIFISTHSPYMFQHCIGSAAKMLLFKEDEKTKKIQKTDSDANDFKHFPWSPSWGEINYFAYNLPTIEFHNELYAALQEKAGDGEVAFEKMLASMTTVTLRPYIQEKSGTKSPPRNISLCTYIRHLIHHADNRNNVQYTEKELRESIEIMLSVLGKS